MLESKVVAHEEANAKVGFWSAWELSPVFGDLVRVCEMSCEIYDVNIWCEIPELCSL